mgnify:CR=1 FL=1
MKKYILCLFTFLILLPISVFASSANIKISAPSEVYVGDTVTVSVTLSSSMSLGSWSYNVSYDESKLQYVSTTAENPGGAAASATGAGKTSVTYKWIFKAKSSGSTSFNVSAISVYSWDVNPDTDSEYDLSPNPTSATIKINQPNNVSGGSNNNGTTKPSTNYNYSSDNYLSSLVVEGFEFEFDKNKTDYSISVPNDTKSVKVGATASDGKAKVNGIGDHELKEGDNLIEIVVTAENGSKRTYNLNVVVIETTPIEVNLGDDTYNVVRKADLLPGTLATYNIDTVLIKGEEVPCYHSDITDFYLIGLRDNDGNIDLYRYDVKEDKFYIYNQLQIGGIYIALLDSEVPSEYTKGTVEINGEQYTAYLKDGSYPLLYGINLETGEKNFYTYDSSENTIQKFVIIEPGFDKYYPYVILGLAGLCLFEFVVIVVTISSKNKKLKKVLHDKLDSKTEYEKSFESKKNSVYKDEENITDDLTDEYMSSDSNTLDTSEELGHTAIISDSVNKVYNNGKNKKEKNKKEKKKSKKHKEKNDDDMFHF